MFRQPVSNARFTKSLFLEESYTDRTYVLYTLKDTDHEGYISLYRKYLEEEDPTEIVFARKYFDGWEHWTMVAESTWFKPYIARWREELELQIRAKALRSLLETSRDTSSKYHYEANKFLLQGLYKPAKGGSKDKVGRPSKEAIQRKAEELFQADRASEEDLLRLKGL